MRSGSWQRVAVVLALAGELACGHGSIAPEPSLAPQAPPLEGEVVAVVGDIAEAGRTADARRTAALVTGHLPRVSAVLLAGDNARYGVGARGLGLLEYYRRFWAPPEEADWGQLDEIAYPQTGNHEFKEKDAQGYFDYFAPRLAAIQAQPGTGGEPSAPGKGWYSFDLGGWHVVSLSSDCGTKGERCAAGSAQERWLAADLAEHAGMPLVAVWHVPRYACGGHASAPALQAFWADLHAAGADLVFNGHNHYYQRWKPLDAASEASPDPEGGLTELVVGSGGVRPTAVCAAPDPRIERQLGGEDGVGVLFLTLSPDGRYTFEYRLARDGSVFDAGSGVSHHASRPAS